MTKAKRVSDAIANFIADPRTSQQYIGDLAVGFEMRRDMPTGFRGGYWFSEEAVETILTALSHG